jgi:hypothetical protein
VIWFFTRESARLSYEIRTAFDDDMYELVVRSSFGSEFRERFSAEEALLKRRAELERILRGLGWREEHVDRAGRRAV